MSPPPPPPIRFYQETKVNDKILFLYCYIEEDEVYKSEVRYAAWDASTFPTNPFTEDPVEAYLNQGHSNSDEHEHPLVETPEGKFEVIFFSCRVEKNTTP